MYVMNKETMGADHVCWLVVLDTLVIHSLVPNI